MITARTVAELEAALALCPANRGFVPTMGGLHEGHMALVDAARQACATVVASIYVNPLQFGPGEDFTAYPRTVEEDRARLAAHGVDVLFLPTDRDIYPRGRDLQTQVHVPVLSDTLCGRFRPGHFHGVATVVARLLGLVRPAVCYLGKKDYQQWRLITQMVADLALPVVVTGVDTVRAPDGLALSTRNTYLTDAQRGIAPALYQTLVAGAERVGAGESYTAVEEASVAALTALGFVPDYVAVRRALDLAAPAADDRALVILAAARLGTTRLIDNHEFRRSPGTDGGHWQ